MYDIIKRKRDGQALTKDEITFLIKEYVNGSLPDYQMAAFLMAVFFKSMNEQETFWLTDAMRRSGDLIELPGIEGFTIDKHSTGGVGDKTSLILGPVLAALGLKVAKLSGRGLGHTGGTIDKLESIKGFSCDLSPETFIATVNRIGLAIAGQTGNIVPADKKIYALRDVTATIDSIPLIAASIMSKKLAVSNHGLVLDVKVGSGAFMKELADARELARTMVAIGKQDGRAVTAVLSNMDEPLGEMIGNALEVREAIDTLHGRGPADLQELIRTLATEALLLAQNPRMSREEASTKIQETFSSGSAFRKFLEMVESQGGQVEMAQNPDLLPRAAEIIPLSSDRDGCISRIHCEEIGIAAMMLGAGRETKEAVIDPAVGLKLLKHVGDDVKTGDILAELHVNPARNNQKAADLILDAFEFCHDPVTPNPLILDIVS
jgi:pyrimidine-nucleoside phosphorylase